MNKQFMMKMVQAKQLEYEALKEILPEPMLNKMAKMEEELIEFGKEYFMNVMYFEKKTNSPASDPETIKKTRKVTIES